MIFDSLLKRYSMTGGQKISGPISWLSGGSESSSGVEVTPEGALSSVAVLSGVRRISQSVAMLPLITYERTLTGRRKKERAYGHSLYSVLHDEPNPEMTSFDFREVMQASMIVRGNAYAEIVRNKFGQVIELWPMRSDRTWVERKNGKLWYHTTVDGTEYVMPREKVFHLKGFSTHGLIGLCIMDLCKDVVGTARAQEMYQAMFFSKGATPAGVLEIPGELEEDEDATAIMDDWNKVYGGLSNKHKIAILEQGMTWKNTGVTPKEAELISGRTFQIQEIARLLDIQAHMLGELSKMSFNNVEELSREFVVYTLGAPMVRWEQKIKQSLLLPEEKKKFFAEFLVEGLLRGNSKDRAEFYRILWNIGALSSNDVRDKENWNPIPDGGDLHFVQLNMVPLESFSDGTPNPENDGEANARAEINKQVRSWSKKVEALAFVEAQRIDAREGTSSAQRLLRYTEKRKVKVGKERLRLRKAYKKIIREAAGRLVRAEIRDIRKALKKHLTRDVGTFRDRADEYYSEEFPGLFDKIMRAVVILYGTEIAQAAASEIDVDAGDVGGFLNSYLRALEQRYGRSSKGQLNSLLTNDEQESLEAVDARLDEWHEKRADKLSDWESVRIEGAAAKAVWIAAGVTTFVWHTTSGDPCPLCLFMDGITVGRESVFLPAGGRIDVEDEDTEPLVTKSDINHPPLHSGCVCQVTAG